MSRTKVLPMTGLLGPHAEDAQRIIDLTSRLTHPQADELSFIWEQDVSPEYDEHCRVVQDALASTGRILPLGWFEAVFADSGWITSTKALHAVADAVVATLVKDVIPHGVFFTLIRPWWQYMSKHTVRKVDLQQIEEICLT